MAETITIQKDTIWKVATAILAVVVLALLLNKGSTAPAAAPSAGDNQPPVVNVDMKTLSDDDPFVGNANSKVTIVEFSDFQCPFCKAFFQQTEGQIITNYVKTGKVKFVYRDFPLSFHVNAEKAAEAANCANKQGKYWEMHDKIFQASQADGTGIAPDDLKKIAAGVSGIDTAKFNACLDSGETAAEIAKDEKDGMAVGIQGTPGFIVNGVVISGAQPYSVFQQVIEAALKA